MDQEISGMRSAALQDTESERVRIEEASRNEASKILRTAEMEIEVSVKAARQELKRYAAQLAVGLAERKIRESLTPQSEHRILRAFVRELGSPKTTGGTAGDPITNTSAPDRN
jgi:F-type H+-transporting ATPase subunit b